MNESKRKNISLSDYFAFRESIGEENLKNIYDEALIEIEQDSKSSASENDCSDLQDKKII